MINPETVLGTRPRSVAIVGLGPSHADYFNDTAKKKSSLNPDEVWVVNSAINVLHAHKAFVMDDLRRLETRYPNFAGRLRVTSTPVITCRQYDDYPTSVAFPIEPVRQTIGFDCFSTTVAYMVAYAVHIKVDDLYLFGCDFFYPGSRTVEAGAMDVAYLLGIARAKGISHRIPLTSTLLNAHLTDAQPDGSAHRPLYGYHYNPGESAERVKRGKGTALDHKVAAFAPFAFSAPDSGGEAMAPIVAQVPASEQGAPAARVDGGA